MQSGCAIDGPFVAISSEHSSRLPTVSIDFLSILLDVRVDGVRSHVEIQQVDLK